MPEPLIRIEAIAAPLPLENVDTDMIWPGMPNAPLTRGAQARQAFHRLRFAPDGVELEDFVLNRDPWREARILIAGDNFGCGSSREMAVWALTEWGLRCVIAPRFGDIFYNNCIYNGLLPVVLPRNEVNRLMELASNSETATMAVDLEACTVTAGNFVASFAIPPRARHGLLQGLDAIGITLAASERITAFGQTYQEERPWIGAVDTEALL